jgi:Uma2 family endonuclease
MNLAEEKRITIEEFYDMREKSDRIIEYIDGVTYMSPSPSTKHQSISMKLGSEIYNYLKGKDCVVFSAPFDVKLKKDDREYPKIVVPDISVICDKTGLDEYGYTGVPTLIIEILSPSNQSHDLVFKLNLYMKYGVKEYWIVNPFLNTVQIYYLNDDGQYYQADVKREEGIVQSIVLKEFEIDIKELFK